MKAALGGGEALCADESPVNVIRNSGDDGAVLAGSPHVVAVRTPDDMPTTTAAWPRWWKPTSTSSRTWTG